MEPRTPIVARGDNLFAIDLLDAERALIAKLMKELAELIEDDPETEMLARLFPTALPDDPTAEAEFQEMVRSELITTRIKRFESVADSVEGSLIDADQLQAWMCAINDARLVLSTRLNISEDDNVEELNEHDPNAMAKSTYWFLGWLLEHIVAATAEEPSE
ncbi:MAG: DUF2017 family protein [Acidimicrobiia bacterium]|nr:DUF2017 family protein [Acidimicrobiia bacterium]MYC57651.1 DUF2017 family protein [Acidimicrobiia bacterium]MYI31227.1 DUF2017 family protein [Acidimicrobiia bacterium]